MLEAIKTLEPAVRHDKHYAQVIEYPYFGAHDRSKWLVEVKKREYKAGTCFDSFKERGCEEDIDVMNEKFQSLSGYVRHNKFAIMYLGSNAPGANNICDGLLKFAEKQDGRTSFVGYVNGIDGLVNN